jgi:hypothetical protein
VVDIVNGAVPGLTVPSVAKVIVWDAGVTVKLSVTRGASA